MSRFLSRFGTPFFLLYILISVVFLGLIETVFNGGFYFSIRILWLPMAIVIFGVTAWCHTDLAPGRNGKGAWWLPWLMAVILYPVSLLMAWPYVMAVNAFLPSHGSVTYEGPVIDKQTSGGRVTSYQLILDDIRSGEPVTLPVSRAAYAGIPLGQTVHQTFTLGGLGIPYNWRFAGKPSEH